MTSSMTVWIEQFCRIQIAADKYLDHMGPAVDAAAIFHPEADCAVSGFTHLIVERKPSYSRYSLRTSANSVFGTG